MSSSSLAQQLLERDSYPVCRNEDPAFLEKSFARSIESVERIQRQIGELESGRPSPRKKKLRDDLLVYSLHYLVKGAKIPILNQDKFAHLSYLEFLADSNPKYYRSQGGSIIKLYMKLLEKGPYRFLFESYGAEGHGSVKDIVRPIKNTKFRKYLEQQYHYTRIGGKKTPLVDRTPEAFLRQVEEFTPPSTPDQEGTFLDISKLLADSPTEKVSPAALKERIAKVKAALRKNRNDLSKVTVGGFVRLDDGQYVCILLQDGKDNNSDLSQSELEKLINAESHHIQEAQAHSGYFPDIIGIRRSIVEHEGFSAQTLVELYPSIGRRAVVEEVEEAPAMSLGDIKRKFAALEDRLNRMARSSKKPCIQHYSQLFSNFLRFLQTSELDELSTPLVARCLLQIEKIIEKLETLSKKEVHDYSEFLSEIDLLTEEIVYLLTILKPFDTTLEETLNKQGVVFSGEVGEKASYVFSSGMNGFAQVFSALRKQSKEGEKLKIGYSSTNYFELRLEVLPHLKRSFDPDDAPVDPYKPITKDYDVFFLDIYPNEVTLDSVRRVDPIRVIDNLLDNRKGKPLTVVIDTSTSLFSSEDMQLIVDHYKEQIDKGLLNIVAVNSLAKFAMCGLDKYTGGVVQTYNNGTAFKAFNDQLKKRQDKEKLSPEAERFFHLCFRCGHKNIGEYLRVVNSNTEKLYQRLKGALQTGRSAISLSKRDSDKIPMLSFKYDQFVARLVAAGKIRKEDALDVQANLSTLLQYYIYALAKAEGLPMDNRLSFGFAHANIGECWIALRLTVGLEDEATLEKYAQLFIKANAELERLAETPLFESMLKQKGGFFYDRFKDTVARRAILQEVGKKPSLEVFFGAIKKAFIEMPASAALPVAEPSPSAALPVAEPLPSALPAAEPLPSALPAAEVLESSSSVVTTALGIRDAFTSHVRRNARTYGFAAAALGLTIGAYRLITRRS